MLRNLFISRIAPGKLFLIIAVVMFSAVVSNALHAAERIALQASDGTYIRAGVTENTLLATGSPHIKGWETFTLIRLSDGKIALKSEQNGKYVRAGVGQNSLLAAVSSRIGGWEQFEIVGSGNTVVLKSVQSGKCVRATERGYLSATARECIDAEPKLSIVLLP